MPNYRIGFSALAAGPLEAGAAERLAAVLRALPGAGSVESVEQDGARRRVAAGFWIEVRLGMADAARDGSRLAKEALKSAGLGDALLVELAVALADPDRASEAE